MRKGLNLYPYTWNQLVSMRSENTPTGPDNEAVKRRSDAYMGIHNNCNHVTGSDPFCTRIGATQDQNPQMAQLELGSQPAGTAFPGLGSVFPGSSVLARDPDVLHRMDSMTITGTRWA